MGKSFTELPVNNENPDNFIKNQTAVISAMNINWLQ